MVAYRKLSPREEQHYKNYSSCVQIDVEDYDAVCNDEETLKQLCCERAGISRKQLHSLEYEYFINDSFHQIGVYYDATWQQPEPEPQKLVNKTRRSIAL